MKTGKNFIVTMAVGVLITTGCGISSAKTSRDEARNLTDQTVEKKLSDIIVEVFPDPAVFTDMQRKMTATTGEAEKMTVERAKRIAIVRSILNNETCTSGNSNLPNC